MRKLFLSLGCTALVAMGVSTTSAADIYKLPAGSPELKSAGPLAFGPEGILLIGDTKSAAIVAIQTVTKGALRRRRNTTSPICRQDRQGPRHDKAQINDLAVNPESGNLYLSVNAGGPKIVKLTANGEIKALTLKDVGFSRVELPNAPEDKVTGEGPRARNNRDTSITDLAWVNGQVIVSGSIAGTASSGVRALNFPFGDKNATSNLEIYHAAHARSEDNAIIRTFVPFNINGEPSVLAGFTCTPLVKFSVAENRRERQNQRDHGRGTRQPQPAARHDRLQAGRQGLSPDGEQRARRDEDQHGEHRPQGRFDATRRRRRNGRSSVRNDCRAAGDHATRQAE